MSFRLPRGTPNTPPPPGWPSLSSRLAHVATLAWQGAPGGCFADVGCDHGRLAAALAGRGATVVALDRAPGALAAARAALEGRPRVAVRASDGLGALALGEVDLAVLAGMGARQILRIVDRAGARCPPQLVLQPQSELRELRRGMAARGWRVEVEVALAERGRGYFVARWGRGASTQDDPFGLGPAALDDDPVQRLWLADLDARMAAAGAAPALRAALAARCGSAR